MPIWFGLTWLELRRETGDERMMPLGHAVATLVPGANAWIAWRHFAAINALAAKAGVGKMRGQDRVPVADPLTAAIGITIWWLTFTHYSSDPLFLALDAIELAAGTAVLIYGQRGLNAVLSTRGVEEHIVETDVIALAIAGTYALFTIVGFLQGGP